MENRLIIKKITFNKTNDSYKQDIKIKLYHSDFIQTSDIFWDYSNGQIINWKFVFDYEPGKNIDFIILDDELFNQDNIIGQANIIQDYEIKSNYILEMYEFPEPITKEIEIKKESEIVGKMLIHQYIIPKEFNKIFKTGTGWNLPDSYPKLSLFPLKKNNEIYQHIKIIDDKFGIEEKSNFDLYSEAFSRIIDEPENKPPLCFGIVGPDNFGKTNFLHNLKNKIVAKEKSRYKNKYNPKKVIIEFNAWSFEADNTIWASILMKVHDALEEKIGKSKIKWLRVKKNLFPDYKSKILFGLKIIIPVILLVLLIYYIPYLNYLSQIIFSLIVGLTSLAFFSDVFTFVKNMVFTISDDISRTMEKPDWSKKLGFMNEIKTEFFDFINPIIKENNLRLILLIDDLDRCSIEKIYTVIKALSLLKNSDCPIYIFIVYDSVKINDAIHTYYKIKYHVNTSESAYLLEKLINIPFCLPEKNIIENLRLIDEYLDEEYFLNLRNDLIKKIPEEYINYRNGNVDMDKSFEDFYQTNFPEKDLPNKKELINNIASLTDNLKEVNNVPDILINIKDEGSEDKLLQIEQNLRRNTLTLNQLENYYRYLIKIEKDFENKSKINEIKNIIYVKFIHLKKDYTNNYYVGLDKEEITIFQRIIVDTKDSGNPLNNYQVKKIINIYSISRFLLPNFLQSKKVILFHLIVLTENWLKIMVKIYLQIKKLKSNLSTYETKECLGEKDLLFFYLNIEKLEKNDDLIIYLTKFEIKVVDFIELEPYIFNLDRCLINKIDEN